MGCDRSRWEYGRGKGEEWVGRHTKLGTRVAGILGGFSGVEEPGWSLSRSGSGGRAQQGGTWPVSQAGTRVYVTGTGEFGRC